MKTLVLYHKNCIDGWVAALMAYQALGSEDVEYIPIQHHEEPPKFEEYDRVYILDYSVFPVPLNAVMLDHHKTAMEKMRSIVDEEIKGDRYFNVSDGLINGFRQQVLIDLSKSGARLAQEYFHGPDHWIVDYAEDHDLWKFQLPNSKEVKAGFMTLPREDVIKNAQKWFSAEFGVVQVTGKTIVAYEQAIIGMLVANAMDLRIFSHGSYFDCKMVNTGQLISQIGHEICQKHGVDNACMWFQVDNETIVVSVRGKNARLIAESFGGGGHDNAAGFQLTNDEQILQLIRGELRA